LSQQTDVFVVVGQKLEKDRVKGCGEMFSFLNDIGSTPVNEHVSALDVSDNDQNLFQSSLNSQKILFVRNRFVTNFEFDTNIRTINDLREGQILSGIVNNITNFGCFVDLGIKEKGLVHISNMAHKYISDPTTIVSIHQHVQAKVLAIDMERKRIQLTMKMQEKQI
jgi:ribosomal protein S1